jgi:hypothetical protein
VRANEVRHVGCPQVAGKKVRTELGRNIEKLHDGDQWNGKVGQMSTARKRQHDTALS